MLANLRTKNYGVLSDLDLDFKPGLTAITGESGAGKSTLLRALTAPWEQSKNNGDGFVESTWNESDNEDLVAGRLWKNNRSYATLDGMKTKQDNLPAPPYLIVRQGAAIWLRSASTARDTVDRNSRVIGSYRKQWSAYEQAKKAYFEHIEKMKTLNRSGLEETIKDLEPLVSTGDAAAEYAHLMAEEQRLKELVALTQERQQQLSMLGENGEVFDALSQWVTTLSSPSASEAYQTLYDEYQSLLSGEFADESELIEIQERTYLYETMEYRYGPTSEWDRIYADAERNLEVLDQGQERAYKLKAAWDQEKDKLLEIAAKLHRERKKLAEIATKEIRGHLGHLGLDNTGFEIVIDNKDVKPSPTGADAIRLMWDPNKLGLVPVGEGASGGELSRIMLAIQNILHTAGVYVYDEIDSGLSGSALATVGKYLREQAKTAQVIIITHSPVLAAQAKQHVVLEKIKGRTRARYVEDQEREAALLAMLGADVSDEEKAVVMKALARIDN